MIHYISIIILILTGIYTFMYSKLTGLLICSAIGLICASFIDSFQIVVAITVLFAVIYTMYIRQYTKKYEPFVNQLPIQIPKIKKNIPEITGVYNPKIEGFADISSSTSDKTSDTSGSSSKSTPASSTNQGESTNLMKNVTTALDKKNPLDSIESEEFASATNTLFKLGKMPSEHADGPKLDAGKTMQTALSSIDPNTVSAMNKDTKNLLQTQQSLMQMLTQMGPVIADGQKLVQTFSSMFGNSGGQFQLGNLGALGAN